MRIICLNLQQDPLAEREKRVRRRLYFARWLRGIHHRRNAMRIELLAQRQFARAFLILRTVSNRIPGKLDKLRKRFTRVSFPDLRRRPRSLRDRHRLISPAVNRNLKRVANLEIGR